MKMLKVIIPVAAVLLLAGQAAAQTDEDKRLQAEEERARAMEARELEMEEKLRLAEERMAAAAREIAELTEERLPRMIEIEKRFAMTNKPMLGVTIETTDKDGPVEGVSLAGVTPGGAAADAGLRSGDILTSVNNEALNADTGKAANGRLLDFMKGVEEGDVLTVEYLRDGKVGKVEIEPRVMSGNRFVWMDKDGGPQTFDLHVAPPAPGAVQELKMAMGFPWVHTALGKLELVELNEGLGRYFGTDKGLLVVKAPGSEAVDIRDGDVIQSIDGREPKDTRHAMRILGSYQPGEKLKLGIMRDKRKKTIDIEIPADHQGNLNDGFEFENSFEFEIRPAMAPAPARPPRAPLPDEDVIIVDVTS